MASGNTFSTTSKAARATPCLVFLGAMLIFGGAIRAQDLPGFGNLASPASRFITQGARQLAKGDFVKAISSYNTAISLESKNAEAYMGRALAKQLAGRLDDALADYARALEIRPHFAQLHCNYGSLLLQRGDVAGASVEFSTAIKLDKHLAEAYAALGRIDFDRHNYSDALSRLDRAIKLFPPYFQDAVKVSARNPHLAAAYDLRGQIRQASGDPKGALEDFDKAIEIETRPRFLNNRGQARARSGDFPGAISDYSAALQINPNLTVAYFNRGQARLRNSNFDDAASDFTETLIRSDDLAKSADTLPDGISPQAILYTSYLGRGLAWEGVSNYSRAERDYGQAIKLNPESGVAFACRGRIYLEMGRLDQAISELDTAIQKSPTWPMAFMDRGLARLLKGDQSAAQSDFDKCLSLSPDLRALLDKRVNIAQASLKKRPVGISDP